MFWKRIMTENKVHGASMSRRLPAWNIRRRTRENTIIWNSHVRRWGYYGSCTYDTCTALLLLFCLYVSCLGTHTKYTRGTKAASSAILYSPFCPNQRWKNGWISQFTPLGSHILYNLTKPKYHITGPTRETRFLLV